MSPGQAAIELVYPKVVKLILGGIGLALTGIGASLLIDTARKCCDSWSQVVLACVIVGFVLRFGIALLVEPSKRIVFQGRRLTVSWIGGLYRQEYVLNLEMVLAFEHREDPRYGVTERLKLHQGRSRCVINSVMIGFEPFCTYLREIL